MSNSYPITGIDPRAGDSRSSPLPPPSRPEPQLLRQEVDNWYQETDKDGSKKNEIQINLFFLALSRFQKMDVPEMLSYFRVAGIHAQPRRSWDQPEPGPVESYCTHGRILFPTWHRPYVLLYEQRLYEIMMEEIAKFPTEFQDRMRSEAKAWRLPYWDWAADRAPHGAQRPDYRLPHIAREKEVYITYGHGPDQATTTERRPNPMYQFSTPKHMGDYGDYGLKAVSILDDTSDKKKTYPYNICRATSRWPPDPTDQNAWINGVQNNDKVDAALRDASLYGRNLGEATARIFGIPQYNDFSSTKYDDQGRSGEYISLEFVHNNIHNWVGGNATGGHMAEIDVAAFDPIFWMHHCNVDRIFAIWQELYPQAWFERKPGEKDNSSTPLKPFHTDKNYTQYTSDLARHVFSLHYSYPEIQPWLDEYYNDGQFNEMRYLDELRKQINLLYGSTRKTVVQLREYVHGTEITDYVVNVIYERHALGGESYTIHLFLKDVENARIGEDGETGKVARAQVGSVYNFSSPVTDGGCENCSRQEEAGERSRAQVPITSALLEELILHTDQPTKSAWENTDVEKYLTEHLEWTVTKAFGQVVPLESIPSLHIFVARGKAIHHAKHELSEHKDYKVLYGVTSGKLGGLERDYAF